MPLGLIPISTLPISTMLQPPSEEVAGAVGTAPPLDLPAPFMTGEEFPSAHPVEERATQQAAPVDVPSLFSSPVGEEFVAAPAVPALEDQTPAFTPILDQPPSLAVSL